MLTNEVVRSSLPALGSAGERGLASRTDRLGGRITGESTPMIGHEEILVIDDRAALRPAQIVETKLTRLLQEASLPASHLQTRRMLRMR